MLKVYTLPQISNRTENKYAEILSCILDLGELLLISGAEVMRVEDTIIRLCMVYGFTKVEVFTIISSIVLTVQNGEGDTLTQTRRIYARDTNLGRVEQVNALSRHICANPVSLKTFQQEIKRIRDQKAYSSVSKCLMYAVVSAAFSLFFGGNFVDSITAALSGILMFEMFCLCQHLYINGALKNLLVSSLTALAVLGMVNLGLGEHPDKIIIGNIMLLIPGLALTTSLKDMLHGDTLSGLLGLYEAVLKALIVAMGFAVVIILAGK